MERKKRTRTPPYDQQADAYFDRCQQEGLHPSLPGLALALGLDTRQELVRQANGGSPQAQALRRAISQVEDANVQSIYKKDLAASAKFMLQNGFGYSEKAAAQPQEEIRVSIEEAGP